MAGQVEERPSEHAPLRVQEAIWFGEQTADVAAASNLPLTIDLHGDSNVDAIRDAVAAVVAAQPTLRSAFAVRRGRLVRDDDNRPPVAVEAHELGGADLERELDRRLRTPLDLVEHPLDVALFTRASGERLLFVNAHHAIFDGTSKDLFAEQFAVAYDALAAGGAPRLAEGVGAEDLAEREQRRMAQLEEQAAEYWPHELTRLRERLPFPASVHRKAPGRPQAVRFDLDPRVSRIVSTLGERFGVSRFVVLLGAVQLLQHVYAGRAEGEVATLIPMGLRDRRLANTMGMLVNELPVRACPRARMLLGEFLVHVGRQVGHVSALRDFPFNEALTRWAGAGDPVAAIPRFGLSYRRGSSGARRAGGVLLRPDAMRPTYGTRWDARFRFVDEGRSVLGILEYDDGVLHAAAARRFADQLVTLVQACGEQPSARLEHLSPLPAAERATLLRDWNRTTVPRARATVQELWEEQVVRVPDRVAVRCDGVELSYRELNARVNTLASRLVALGAATHTRVAIYLERGIGVPIALLAIAKTGATFVPLDPLNPAERIGYMLDDSDARIVVTQRELLGTIDTERRQVVRIDAPTRPSPEPDPRPNPPVRAHPESIACVIYTSGSTGQPKGALLRQDAVVNLVREMTTAPGMTEDDVYVSLTTVAFDVGTAEVLAPLSVGACLWIASAEDVSDSERLARLLDEGDATITFATPSRWRMLLGAGWAGRQRVITAGEALTPDLAIELVHRSPEVWNAYGPAETFAFSTLKRVDEPSRNSIGRPIANTRAYVVDRHGELAPIGVAGELWLGGTGVAEGYINRPELTRERFSEDPFARGRVYRTGDVARFRDDGELEFLGRIDDQVKIRGFRVEPGEVQQVLARQAGVRAAAVVWYEPRSGDKRLAAYVVPGERRPTVTELRAGVAASLPAFMVPAAFTFLDELPLNPNGKVDRRRLPAPGLFEEADPAATPPTGATEEALARVWCAVLRIDHVGRDDDFFELGGHSLLAAEMATQAREALGRPVPVRLLFAGPTIAQLAALVEDDGTPARDEPIPRAERRPFLPG